MEDEAKASFRLGKARWRGCPTAEIVGSGKAVEE